MKDHNTFTIFPYRNRLIKLDHLQAGKIIYRDYQVDIVSGKKIKQTATDWFAELNYHVDSFFNMPMVIHFFYEFGFITNNLENDYIEPDDILAIELIYAQNSNFKIKAAAPIKLEALQLPDFESYRKEFELGRQELLKGNCYQFNLTKEFKYKILSNNSPMDFINKAWLHRASRGAYGSATYLPYLKKLFFSNSPECLFEIDEHIITSRPIKGTIPYAIGDNFQMAWDRLATDKKNQSELYMITDLLRNDLSKIELPKAIVTEKKAPLIVPNLLHQYSEIKVEVSSKVLLKKVMKDLFPGGSITGAPKKNTMRILNKLEKRKRGFYCGSTLILYKEMKAASINIRSSEIDMSTNTLSYQAGGGITLNSISNNEFEEMSYKAMSFINLLTP